MAFPAYAPIVAICVVAVCLLLSKTSFLGIADPELFLLDAKTPGADCSADSTLVETLCCDVKSRKIAMGEQEAGASWCVERKAQDGGSSRSSSSTAPGNSLAFLCLAYNDQTITGCAFSIALLYAPHHLFVIHLDEKTPKNSRAGLLELVAGFDNIAIIPEERSLHAAWGKPGLAQAQNRLMCYAHLLHSRVPWRFAMFMDGTSMPLQTIAEFEESFRQVPDSVIISVEWARVCWDRQKNLCHRARKPTPNEKPFLKASNWFVFSSAGAAWVCPRLQQEQEHLLSPNASDADPETELVHAWEQFFSDRRSFSMASDESFTMTILAVRATGNVWGDDTQQLLCDMQNGSPKTVLCRWNWYIDWDVKHCKSHRAVARNGHSVRGSPCYLGLQDWEVLHEQRSQGVLWTRKVEATDPLRGRMANCLMRKTQKDFQSVLADQLGKHWRGLHSTCKDGDKHAGTATCNLVHELLQLDKNAMEEHRWVGTQCENMTSPWS